MSFLKREDASLFGELKREPKPQGSFVLKLQRLLEGEGGDRKQTKEKVGFW